MVSWLTRIIGSCGNSLRKQFTISSGDHHFSRPSITLATSGLWLSLVGFGRLACS